MAMIRVRWVPDAVMTELIEVQDEHAAADGNTKRKSPRKWALGGAVRLHQINV